MHAMDGDWFGVFLTSKWTSVLKQRLYVVFLFSAPAKKKCLVMGLIENEENFFLKKKKNDQIVLKLR